MKKGLAILIFVLFFSSFSFGYKELLIEDRGGKPIRVIKVILDGQDFVVTSLAGNGGDTVENLAKKVGGDTAINGTFFCPADYTYCGGVTHSNFERVYLGNGSMYSSFWPNTDVRVIFGFDKEGDPLIVQNNQSEMGGLWSDVNSDKLDDLEFGLSNFTVLLIQGDDVAKANEKYYDAKMYSKINRNFICSTKDKSTVYMGVVGGINIIDLAGYIKEQFDCYDALALDAGYSSAMVYDSNVLERSTRRQIMDSFVVVDRAAYIDLTQTVPPVKEAYVPKDTYTLTAADKEFVSKVYVLIKQVEKKKGSNIKWTFIKALRSAISSEEFKNNEQRKAIFHALLVKLFTVDTL